MSRFDGEDASEAHVIADGSAEGRALDDQIESGEVDGDDEVFDAIPEGTEDGRVLDGKIDPDDDEPEAQPDLLELFV